MFKNSLSRRTGGGSSTDQRRRAGKRRSDRGGRTLRLEILENRSLLSGNTWLGGLLGAGFNVPAIHGPVTLGTNWNTSAATQLSLRLPPAVAIGTPVTITVDALSAANGLARGYTGTLTVTSNASTAVLPTNNGDITFHNGVATFKVTFPTAAAGTTVTVTDNSTPPLTATETTDVVDPTVVSQFDLHLPRAVLLNTSVTVHVVAENGLDRPVTSYDASVVVTSSTAATIGAVTWDNGVGTFQVTFTAASTSTTLTVKDPTTSVSQTATTMVVDPNVATQFLVSAPHKVAIGTSFNITVTALNGFGAPVTSYTGPVTVSTSDLKGTVPTTPVSLTNGKATIAVTLATPSTSASPTTLTVADDSSPTPNTSLTKTVDIVAIDPTVVTGFRVYLPLFVQENTATTVQVTAINGLGAPVASFGTTAPPVITVTSTTDTTATISPDPKTLTFTGGTASFTVSFDATGKQSLTVGDVGTPTVTQTVTTYVGPALSGNGSGGFGGLGGLLGGLSGLLSGFGWF
ncbi:MAG: hypothetical protein ABSG53_05970 [Thermoguttaceae bacterium]